MFETNNKSIHLKVLFVENNTKKPKLNNTKKLKLAYKSKYDSNCTNHLNFLIITMALPCSEKTMCIVT